MNMVMNRRLVLRLVGFTRCALAMIMFSPTFRSVQEIQRRKLLALSDGML